MYTNIQGRQSHYRSSRLLGASRIAGAAKMQFQAISFCAAVAAFRHSYYYLRPLNFLFCGAILKYWPAPSKKSEMGRSEAKLLLRTHRGRHRVHKYGNHLRLMKRKNNPLF